jgi:hypothetical protein
MASKTHCRESGKARQLELWPEGPRAAGSIITPVIGRILTKHGRRRAGGNISRTWAELGYGRPAANDADFGGAV